MKETEIGIVIVEGYQTRTGKTADTAFYQGVQELCSKYKVFFAVNEVYSGFGASGGAWWASSEWGLTSEPDFLIFGGRAQTSGFFAPRSLL